MKKNLFLFLLIFIINSCNNQDNRNNRDKVIVEEKNLIADKILSNKIFSPDFITRVGDKLLISSHLSDTVLYVYSLPSLTYLNSTGTKGAGPDDFQIFPMFCESFDNMLYVWGFNLVTIKKFAINQSGELNFEGLIKLSKYEAFNNMHIINDSLFIYYLPDYLKTVKFDLKKDKETDKIQMKKDNHNESFFYSNRGSIAANNSFLIYGYLFKKQIDIYKMHDFKLLKRIIGDYEYKEPVLGDFNPPVYYRNIVAGNQFFYALCNENSNKEVIMEVYNYDGVLVKKFTFDIPPQLFVIDEENNTMYGYSGEYEDYLLRYKL
jgi:hypothetical protein